MKQEDLDAALKSAPVLTELDSKQQEEVEQVLKMPGLLHLWGLLMGSRQTNLVALSYAGLGSTPELTAAARIQGIIRGIELVRDTLLEQTVPSQTDKETEQK